MVQRSVEHYKSIERYYSDIQDIVRLVMGGRVKQ